MKQMKLAICMLFAVGLFPANAMPQTAVTVGGLQCEYANQPVGIDVETPRFGWKLTDDKHTRGQKQTAYHILVATDRRLLEKNQADVWDSGKVTSGQSVLIPFQGKPLLPSRDYFWKVQVFDKDGKPSAWSEPARFVTGLLSPDDWGEAEWIKHPEAPETKHIWFRKSFTLAAPVRLALIHVASAGYHELYVNGKKADDRVLAPALTRLNKRVFVITYDISDLLQPGDNVIALWQASGWASYEYFKLPSCLRARLDIETDARQHVQVFSDKTWRCEVSNSENTRSVLTYNDNGGERVDGRAFLPDWNRVAFDDHRWPHPVTVDFQTGFCSHATFEPTRVIETLSPVSITGDKTCTVDMGKNFTGWVNIRMSGLAAGDTVTIMAADDDRSVCDFNQRSFYIGSGAPEESFCNRFNYMAGRYITIEGLKHAPDLSDITGYALSTDLKRTGSFSSSNPLFNQIYEMDLWTFLANTTEGYTSDCPHRERMGYGEVATATSWGIGLPNYDAGAFYRKIVRDWTDVQEADGWVNHTAPQPAEHYGGPMWSSAGLNVSWEHYIHYGDPRILESIYSSAGRWLDFLHQHTEEGLLKPYTEHWGKFLGDWAAPGQRKERGDSPQAKYFNNCVYAMNLQTFVEMANLLGHADDAALYGSRLNALRPRIHEVFFSPGDGTYSDGNQVQQAFALLTGVVPAQSVAAVTARFQKELNETHPYLDMGSSGLPVLLHYLVAHPENGAAVARLLNQTTEPGYGYFIRRGETAWPEYWNVDVDSKIHTCYTGIASWFVKGLCGIQPDAARPGYRSFIIRPVIVAETTFAGASVESPYGTIRSRWERTAGRLELSVTVPPNSSATIYIPSARLESITESGVPVRKAKGVTWQRMEGDCAVVSVEAGQYRFAAEAE